MHNFKKCRSCGSPVKGNRFYCDKTECQRRAAADRKARSRAGNTRKATKPTVVEGDQDDGDGFEAFLAEFDGPSTEFEHARFGPYIGNHGYRLDAVYAFLVEREGWVPGPTPPPSPYFFLGTWRRVLISGLSGGLSRSRGQGNEGLPMVFRVPGRAPVRC